MNRCSCPAVFCLQQSHEKPEDNCNGFFSKTGPWFSNANYKSEDPISYRKALFSSRNRCGCPAFCLHRVEIAQQTGRRTGDVTAAVIEQSPS